MAESDTPALVEKQPPEELGRIARHFDQRAAGYSKKYGSPRARDLFEHEKRRRMEIACSAIVQHFNRASPRRVLDVGCGTGQLICRILTARPSWQAVGIDLSPRMIEQAAARADRFEIAGRSQWHVASDVPDRFDAVVSLGVLGYQNDQRAFLGQLASKVEPGGLVVLTFGNAASLLRRARDVAIDARRLLARRQPRLRFQGVRLAEVDRVLANRGFRRVQLHWLAFGLGLGHWKTEPRLSAIAERFVGRARSAERLAQVGLAVYQA